ncbi:MAG: hypothetical protein KDD83_29695, partial [Caldilineaceae bacterium]|nr:hypothetical protein [Caldilineaceae bacterium]
PQQEQGQRQQRTRQKSVRKQQPFHGQPRWVFLWRNARSWWASALQMECQSPRRLLGVGVGFQPHKSEPDMFAATVQRILNTFRNLAVGFIPQIPIPYDFVNF